MAACQKEVGLSAFEMLMQEKSWKIIKNYSLAEMVSVYKSRF